MDTPRLRSALDQVPAYVAGKPPVAREGLTVYKVSSNENPYPPLPSVVQVIEAAATQVNRYPDMGVTALTDALAAHLEVPREQIATGTGSVGVLAQIIQSTCDPGDEVVYAWRSFEAYPIVVAIAGAVSVQVPLTADHRHDLDAMAAAITDRTRLIFLCNPNNPSGTTISQEEFDSFMAQVPEEVIVGLDEAYFEYNRAEDTVLATEAITRHPNVVGLRTFSKAYGLAGVRVGYAFGAPEIIAALNKLAIPFAVSSVAQAGAVASLAAADELLERTEETVAERDRVAEALGTRPSQANFVWLPAEDLTGRLGATPAELAARLAEHGVLVRAFPEGVRVTVTTASEADRLLAAWREAGL